MSTPAFVKNRGVSDLVESCDIDLTPMMSMFIILIPFLVSMAVLTHLSVIDFGLPPNVNAGMDTSGGAPRLKPTVVVAPSYLSIALGDKLIDSLAAGADGYDLARFSERLRTLRAEQADGEIVVAVRDEVKISQVVGVMDRCRDAGFGAIGLSSATVDPTKGR